eukprot:Rmarinus@m.4654
MGGGNSTMKDKDRKVDPTRTLSITNNYPSASEFEPGSFWIISYAQVNTSAAAALSDRLAARGVNSWFGGCQRTGNWMDVWKDKYAVSKGVLILLTKNYENDNNCLAEMATIGEEPPKKLVVYQMEQCETPDTLSALLSDENVVSCVIDAHDVSLDGGGVQNIESLATRMDGNAMSWDFGRRIFSQQDLADLSQVGTYVKSTPVFAFRTSDPVSVHKTAWGDNRTSSTQAGGWVIISQTVKDGLSDYEGTRDMYTVSHDEFDTCYEPYYVNGRIVPGMYCKLSKVLAAPAEVSFKIHAETKAEETLEPGDFLVQPVGDTLGMSAQWKIPKDLFLLSYIPEGDTGGLSAARRSSIGRNRSDTVTRELCAFLQQNRAQFQVSGSGPASPSGHRARTNTEFLPASSTPPPSLQSSLNRNSSEVPAILDAASKDKQPASPSKRCVEGTP